MNRPDYDAAFKRIYHDAELVRSYLAYTGVHESIYNSLDFSTLKPMPTELISDKLIKRHADSIWQVDYRARGDGSLYIVVHVEFQSSNDMSMAFRMNVYAALIYQALWRGSGKSAADGKLPTVLPVVLYTGEAEWTAPLEIRPYLSEKERELQPLFKYLLIDERRLTQSGKARLKDLAGSLMVLRHSSDYAMIKEARIRIVESDSYLANRQAYDELVQHVGVYNLGTEVKNMEQFASKLEEMEDNARRRWTAVGLKDGIERGIEQGRDKGQEEIVKWMLRKGWSVNDIRDSTGLTVKRIRSLQGDD